MVRATFEVPGSGTVGFTEDGSGVLLERIHERQTAAKGVELRAFDASGSIAVEHTLKQVPKGIPVGCAVSPTGEQVAAGFKSVPLFDVPTGKKVGSFKGPKRHVGRESLAFSPDGARLAIADGSYVNPRDRNVRVFDIASGEEQVRIKTPAWQMDQVVFAGDDLLVLSGLHHTYEFKDRSTHPMVVCACEIDTGKTRFEVRLAPNRRGFTVDLHRRVVWVVMPEGCVPIALDSGEPAGDPRKERVAATFGERLLLQVHDGSFVFYDPAEKEGRRLPRPKAGKHPYFAWHPTALRLAMPTSPTTTGVWDLAAL